MEKIATEDGLALRVGLHRVVDGGKPVRCRRPALAGGAAFKMKKPAPRISEGVRKSYQRLAAAFSEGGSSLTLPKAALLRALLHGGSIYQRQIVEFTGMDRSTVSDVLQRMAAEGLVANVRKEEDQRAVMVTITPAGRKALQVADSALFVSEAALMRLVPSKDRPAFLRSLRAIAEAG